MYGSENDPMFTPNTIILTPAEMREFLRKANEDNTRAHRAAYRAKLRARAEARRKGQEVSP